MTSDVDLATVGRWAGFGAAAAGLLGAGWLLGFWVLPYLEVSLAGIRLADDPGSLGAENAPVVAFWATVLVGCSALVAWAVRRESLRTLWLFAAALLVLAVLSLFSIGALVAPFAVLTLLSAALLTLGRRLSGASDAAAT